MEWLTLGRRVPVPGIWRVGQTPPPKKKTACGSGQPVTATQSKPGDTELSGAAGAWPRDARPAAWPPRMSSYAWVSDFIISRKEPEKNLKETCPCLRNVHRGSRREAASHSGGGRPPRACGRGSCGRRQAGTAVSPWPAQGPSQSSGSTGAADEAGEGWCLTRGPRRPCSLAPHRRVTRRLRGTSPAPPAAGK